MYNSSQRYGTILTLSYISKSNKK